MFGKNLKLMKIFQVLRCLCVSLLTVGCSSFGSTYVRVRNASALNFDDVVVYSRRVHTNGFFGPIASGGVSDYRVFPKAYRYGSVRIKSGTNHFGFYPTDYDSEAPLGPGYFTYDLTVSGGLVEIHATKDR